MNTISIISFVLATGAVAFFTYQIVRRMKKSDTPLKSILLVAEPWHGL
jgi:hypothetical protein